MPGWPVRKTCGSTVALCPNGVAAKTVTQIGTDIDEKWDFLLYRIGVILQVVGNTCSTALVAASREVIQKIELKEDMAIDSGVLRFLFLFSFSII